jgi:hypothetical protein
MLLYLVLERLARVAVIVQVCGLCFYVDCVPYVAVYGLKYVASMPLYGCYYGLESRPWTMLCFNGLNDAFFLCLLL